MALKYVPHTHQSKKWTVTAYKSSNTYWPIFPFLRQKDLTTTAYINKDIHLISRKAKLIYKE